MNRHPLDRLLAPTTSIPLEDPPYGTQDGGRGIRCTPGEGRPRWLYLDAWRVFATPGSARGPAGPLPAFRDDSEAQFPLAPLDGGSVAVPFSLAEAYENYVRERWIASTRQRRLPTPVLNAFYVAKQAIPRGLQMTARRALIRWQGSPEFPRWPFDASVGRLLELYARLAIEVGDADRLAFRWFWPRGRRAALVLTHDVESEAGLRNAVKVADLEEERGLRSSFNVVGDWYPIDWGIVEELSQRGFELGVHGILHDRSLFSDRREFERQLPLLADFRAQLHADGFRSPATHRIVDWLQELPTSYDCTVPMSDPYEPQPGGCCSPWPFFLGDVLELPYTMPQDHTLFILKRERDISTWTRQLDSIEASYGLAQWVTHPDPGYLEDPRIRALYIELLDLVASRPSLWHALPREVASWWRRRDDGTADAAELATGHAVPDDRWLAVFVPPE